VKTVVFSDKGTNDLVAYFKQSEEEPGAAALEEMAKVCAQRDVLKTEREVAAVLKTMADRLNGLRHSQIESLQNILSADDNEAWTTFRDADRGTASYTDVVALVLSGELSTDRVFERSCTAPDHSRRAVPLAHDGGAR
jgi:hypothetical protein